MSDNNTCETCGKPVEVQIQKNTGFCCARCEDAWDLKKAVRSIDAWALKKVVRSEDEKESKDN